MISFRSTKVTVPIRRVWSPFVAAVAALVALAPRPAHASEDRWWYLDGFVEIGITDISVPTEGYLAVPTIGPGATALWRLVPWVHAGAGARFTTIMPPAPSWGDYYILTVPVVLKFVLPLSERGHELQLGGGIGIGGYWERLDPDPGYLPPTSESITTTAYEAFLGYVGPRTSTRLSFLAQAGTRYEDMGGTEVVVEKHVFFLRAGVSWR